MQSEATAECVYPAPLGDAALVDSWAEAWRALGRPVPLPLRLELQAVWAEAHRRYHDQIHLRECMALWSLWKGACERPGEVAIALWFHDAIHDPMASGNEENSAAWAFRALIAAGVGQDVAQRVHDMVMATRHSESSTDPDTQLLVDIDLAILGSPSARFARYDRDIRKEYESVPDFRYRLQRAHVLRGFLNRTQIFLRAPNRESLEKRARTNLVAALSGLEHPGSVL